MKLLLQRLLYLLILGVSPALAGTVVINEIMYHPSSENVREEYIEIHNRGTGTVNLAGWRFVNGVDFTFPANTSLEPGGYLVVAADVAAFTAKYFEVTNVVGDWVGRLSNSGETIALQNASGEIESEVSYADAGDWGVRVRGPSSSGTRGWDWQSAADGFGSSLELINPALPNDNGQNWAPSPAPQGTPGRANTSRAVNVAPLIYEVQHAPPVPRSTDFITVNARVVDESASAFSVTLFYRNATADASPPFLSTPMFDDGAHNDGRPGDGVFGATLNPQANGTVIDFYVQTADGANARTWPAPALDEFLNPSQDANATLQVANEVYAGGQPMMRLVMTGRERARLAAVNQNSDAEFNTTLVSVEGTDSKIRYNCGVRIRGAGSRGAAVKNHRLNIPSDRPWNGLTAINLNSQFIHAQLIGNILAQKSGLPAANSRIVQVRFNGANLANSGVPTRGNGSGFGSYILTEPVNNEFASSHFPTDPDGNVYRASSGTHLADLSYRGTNPVTYINRGYSKTSNASENDWTDLIDLTLALSTNTPLANYSNVISQRLNVLEWMTYFAVFSLTDSRETSLGTGEGDDYALYRGLADPRFKLIGHDFDTTFNEGDNAGNVNDSIWRAADFTDQPDVARFLQFPDFAPIYYAELERLATTVFSSGQLNPLMDQFLTSFVPASTISAMKAFAAARNANVRAQIPRSLSVKTRPVVSLTGPANNTVFSAPATIPLMATASDAVGVVRVTFFQDTTRIGEDTSAPYNFNWANVPVGNYTLRAVAADALGLTTTSAPVNVSVTGAVSRVLIASNSFWRYLDNGSDQSVAWRSRIFDDSTWSIGLAELGYGDGDENRVVSFGPDSNNKYITTYFRQTFTITNASAFTSLSLWLLRDDAGVVYLNGTEVYRSPNLPGGSIGFLTRANATGENNIDQATFSPNLLINGANVIAVEIHQESPASTDLSFNFELSGTSFDEAARPAFDFVPAAAFATTNRVVALGGRANAIETRRVTVNGVTAARTPWLGIWQGEVTLNPGINRVLVQAFDAEDRETDRTWIDITYDTGTLTPLSGLLNSDTTLAAGNGPHFVNSTVVVANNATLTVQAGSTLLFAAGASLIVSNGGRLVIEGTETQHVRLSRFGGNGTWGQIRIDGAAGESRLSFVDIEYAGSGSGAIRVNDSAIHMDHVTFTNTSVQYVNLNNSSFDIRDSFFPNTTGVEPIHGVAIPVSGYGIIESNYFGTTTGLNDIIDFTGGQRPGAILQILNNLFTGASDDVLDLDGTDAHVEGNIFMNVHQTTPGGDTASAVSGGQDSGNTSEIVIVRNLFFDCDYAALAKEGNFYTLVNNTMIGLTVAAVNFNEPLRNLAPGAGALLDGNILWHTPRIFANFTNGVMAVTVNRSILPTNFAGLNNLVLDPLLVNTNFGSITPANIRDAFRLRPGSPALASGPNGLDMGALVPAGASISGEPSSPTRDSVATLAIDGPGITDYRYRLNQGPWSGERPVATPLELTGLADGPHTVYVVGRNDAGVWQSTNQPTVSRTWTVNSSFASIRLNEVLARNDTVLVHEGTFPDAIEIYNGGSATLNLSGWGLSDSVTNKFRFAFPLNTSLLPGTYLVVYADETNATSGLHLGFGLRQAGDAVYLHNAGGVLVDSVAFGTQLGDLSIGRDRDGQWTLCTPTLGGPNVTRRLGDPRTLKINEWLADARTLYSEDFIEIYNPNPAPVLLGGLFLSDEPLGWPQQSPVPPLTFMPGNGFYVFIADGRPEAGADHVNFKLSPDQGAIGLADAQGQIIDCVFYGPQVTDVSQGRQPSGGSNIVSFPTASPGVNNSIPSVNCTITTSSFLLVPTNTAWRYDQSGTDLGTAWRAPGFSDGAWPSGSALLAVETSDVYVEPIRTVLRLNRPAGGGQIITYYFRKHFNVSSNLADWNITASAFIDDGAVFYMNGNEVGRVRLTANPTLFNSLAANVNEPAFDQFTFSGTNLVVGDNVMAVEVHQTTANSSDVVFGLALHATLSVTNCSQLAVVLNEVIANNLSITNAGATNAADWVELYNPSSMTADLAGMGLSDSIDLPRRWVFPTGVTMAPGTHLLVRFDNSAPASTNNSGPLNTGFALSAGGDELYLSDAPARGGALLDSVVFGIQVADLSIGRVPQGSGAWRLTLPTPGSLNLGIALGNRAALRINEWLANPSGNDNDFLELYNLNAQPVDLGGLFLTDDLLDPLKYRIPNLSFVGTGEDAFVRFVADDDPTQGADHVNFGLAAGGESLGLFTEAEARIDSLNYAAQDNGVSEGRFPDGATNIVRFRGTTTPGQANVLPLSTIVINEVLTHSDPPLEDAIELHNPTPLSIDISGWYLTDNRTDARRFRIPDGTVVDPNGFVVFYENQFNPNGNGQRPGFALSSVEGDDLYLYTADAAGDLTGFRTGVRFSPAESAVSFGRYPTSVGFDFTPMSQRSFGADSPNTVEEFRLGRGHTNAYPRVGPLVISEVMYHPPDIGTNDNSLDEFVELHNITSSPVPLFDPAYPTNTWRLRDAVDFDFPTNVTLAPGGFLLVVNFNPETNTAQLAAFRLRYGVGMEVPIHGPYGGKLANDTENLELKKPELPQGPGTANPGFVAYLDVDRVKYADEAPWASLADGNTNGAGFSLQRRQAANYGNDPINWIAGVPTPGRPTGPAVLEAPTLSSLTGSHGVLVGTSDAFAAVAAGAGPLRYQWRFNGSLLAGATNATLTLPNIQLTNAGTYSVLAYNSAGADGGSLDLDVHVPAGITQQPQSMNVVPSSDATITVTAFGTAPLSYQWRKDGLEIEGATRPSFTLTNAQLADEGGYSVVITNLYGSITSVVATITVNASPVILAQPRGTNIFVGETARFSVTAVGALPLRYQWRFNGNSILNATNTSLTISNAQVAHGGGYTVFITNRYGAVLSTNAGLTVSARPTIALSAPDSSGAEPGADVGRFQITRSGSTAQPLTVFFSASGTATPGLDYGALPVQATIGTGSNSVSLLVSPRDDADVEGSETVVLTMTPHVSYTVAAPGQATVTIGDNDNLPPSIVLTNPVDGALLAAPADVLLAASASDVGGYITLVEFFYDVTNKIGEVATAPHQVTWTNAPPGLFTLTAVATDDFGVRSTSALVRVTLNGRPLVELISPRHGTPFVSPATIQFVASASDPDGTISGIDFYEGATRLGPGIFNGANYSFAWNNVAPGLYSLTAQATDNFGTISISTQSIVTVMPPSAGFSDNFLTRGILTGFTNFVTGNNAEYTKEPGEPRHARRNGAHSGWVTWTAPVSGRCTLDTEGSSFDTVLAVYTNHPPAVLEVTNLVEVTYNDDANGAVIWSKLNFNAVAGQSYQIAVDGYGPASAGSIVFRLGMTNPYPYIVTHPQSQFAEQGATLAFTVAATGPAPLAYQWRFNGTNILGAVSPTLVRSNVTTAHEGLYAVVVRNNSGSVTSAPASLVVRAAPYLTTPPRNLVADRGDTVVFDVTAGGTSPLSYQWRFNGVAVNGQTNRSYTLANVQYTNAGSYVVTVMNQIGSVSSPPVELLLRPRILSGDLQPDGGFRLNFEVSPNKPHIVERASNATNWTAVVTNTSPLSQRTFLEAGAITNTTRIYRLRVGP